ncbi:MAG: DoxX family protein [Haloarculaceae archaeon]
MVDSRVTVPGALGLLAALSTPAAAHVDYVTDRPGSDVDPIAFLLRVVGEPANAALLAVTAVLVLGFVGAYLRWRPRIPDLAVLVGTLRSYEDLIPWMLRLSLGLPLVGAGYAGYLFAPTVDVSLRFVQVGLGFLLLFGLATRAVALAGLGVYLWAVLAHPGTVLAMEYVPGFLALALLGGGRPSADHMLQRIASTDGTLYGRVDPVHRAAVRLDGLVGPYVDLVPVVLRVGLGIAFVYLGLSQKLGAPGPALAVVEKYGLTGIVPVDPGMWVVGAGLAEMAVGVALILGLLTRATAAVAFLLFTLTLFGLPDDPVLAHVTLFGMASTIFTLGAGPLSIDARIARDRADDRPTATPAD